jgi:hypothetical protein
MEVKWTKLITRMFNIETGQAMHREMRSSLTLVNGVSLKVRKGKN